MFLLNVEHFVNCAALQPRRPYFSWPSAWELQIQNLPQCLRVLWVVASPRWWSQRGYPRYLSPPPLPQDRNRITLGLNRRGGTWRPLKAWNLLWFCYCFITSRQWLPLFRCLVLTVVLAVTATHIGVFCEIRSKYLKFAAKHSVGSCTTPRTVKQ
jgi:hypothetical protein